MIRMPACIARSNGCLVIPRARSIGSKQVLTGKPPGLRNWYITREGQTMAIIRNAGEFMMGSPDHEQGRTADEALHRVRIPRGFAVATTEVTVAQFQRFLEANPKLETRFRDPTKDPRRGSRMM